LPPPETEKNGKEKEKNRSVERSRSKMEKKRKKNRSEKQRNKSLKSTNCVFFSLLQVAVTFIDVVGRQRRRRGFRSTVLLPSSAAAREEDASPLFQHCSYRSRRFSSNVPVAALFLILFWGYFCNFKIV